MSEIRLDPIARTGRKPRKRPPPQYRRCACGKEFPVTVAHRTHCSYDCAQAARERQRVLHVRQTQPCAGCGRKVTVRFTHCYWCRKARQEAIVAAHEDGPPNPGVCGLLIRGGRCLHAVIDGTDRNGGATLYCGIHGERAVPVIRPANFVRYDQREKFEREIGARHKTASQPSDPTYTERFKGHNRVSITVTGRATADRIHAA